MTEISLYLISLLETNMRQHIPVPPKMVKVISYLDFSKAFISRNGEPEFSYMLANL